MASMAKIEHTEELERVARAICLARGFAADEVVQVSSPSDVLFPVPNGRTGAHSEYSGKRWETYAMEAAVFLAALKAAT